MAKRFAGNRALGHGVEIADDLRVPLSDEDSAELRALFLDHGLLLFRGQSLDAAQQRDVMAAIGTPLPNAQGVDYISNDPSKGRLGSSELVFHSDLDFMPEPYTALSLLAVELVDGASSTLFASNRAVLRSLPDRLGERLRGLSLITAFPLDYARGNAGVSWYADVPHVARVPIVEHPQTGEPLLMVSRQAVCFEEMDGAASAALLEELYGHLYAPANVYEHVWHNGDLLIWDNLAFQHARGPIAGCGPRTLQRISCGTQHYYEELYAVAVKAGMAV